MRELKTRKTSANVAAFLKMIADPDRRRDCQTVVGIMREVSGAEPAMWGDSIVGFGGCEYRYADGRTMDWFKIGFSPRKNDLTFYMMSGFEGQERLLNRLGRSKTGKSCLYVKRLADIDVDVLRELMVKSVKHLDQRSRR